MLPWTKILGALSAFPALITIVQKTLSKGRIDPIETLGDLEAVSPDFKKVKNAAMQATANGGGAKEVVQAIQSVGDVEVFGKKINPAHITRDLRASKSKGGTLLANMIDQVCSMTPQEIEAFGEQMGDFNNWT